MNTRDLEANLLKLLKGKHSSLTLSFNDMSAPNYQTVAEIIEDNPSEYEIGWISEEEKAKAAKTNSMWELQWYPDTPVGSYSVAASSLEALLGYVLNAHRSS